MLAIIGKIIVAFAVIPLLLLGELGIIMLRFRDFLLGPIFLVIATSGMAGVLYFFFG